MKRDADGALRLFGFPLKRDRVIDTSDPSCGSPVRAQSPPTTPAKRLLHNGLFALGIEWAPETDPYWEGGGGTFTSQRDPKLN